MTSPKIAIGDKQFLVVDSLARLIESELNYEVCGVTDNPTSLIDIIESQKPQLLIIDYNIMDYAGYEDFVKLKNKLFHDLNIMVLCNQLTSNEVVMLLRSGIKNITLKTATKEEIVLSVEMALRNKKHFSDEIMDLIINNNLHQDTDPVRFILTPSETEVLRLIAGGLTTKEIAGRKNISVHTVMTHRKNIFRKLGVDSISDVTRFAIRKGIINNDLDFII